MYQALFVDDDRFLLQGVEHIIDWKEVDFYLPLTADCVEEAIRLFEQNKIDLLISDIEMPGSTGFDLMEYVKRKYPDTTCCLLSGHATFDYAHSALKLHAFDYLLKPLQKEDLRNLLMRYENIHAEPEKEEIKYSILVKSTMDYVQTHLKEPISRDSITKALHVSEGHISRLFKKETGYSLTDYITKMRIERAKELLVETYDSIAEICEEIGYNYQAYFTKKFHEETGMSPLQYRKEKRQN